jgi:hypothetical protein
MRSSRLRPGLVVQDVTARSELVTVLVSGRVDQADMGKPAKGRGAGSVAADYRADLNDLQV